MLATETAVRERPILFSGEMVRALLAGTKTQTRRVVKGPALRWLDEEGFEPGFVALPANGLCPYGRPGERLWVREAFGHRPDLGRGVGTGLLYRADDCDSVHEWGPFPFSHLYDEVTRWKPSIHMPRWASRITLEITGERVQRVQEISDADAAAEGVERHDDDGATYYGPFNRGHASAAYAYRQLWDSLNAARGYGWDANPWVWCLTFRRVEG